VPITLRCRSCQATLGIPGGRREVVKVCPWCGVENPAQPEPAEPDEPDDELEEAVVLDDPPPKAKKAKAVPAETRTERSSEDRLRELVICLMILLVSGVLAAVGFFLARYLSL